MSQHKQLTAREMVKSPPPPRRTKKLNLLFKSRLLDRISDLGWFGDYLRLGKIARRADTSSARQHSSSRNAPLQRSAVPSALLLALGLSLLRPLPAYAALTSSVIGGVLTVSSSGTDDIIIECVGGNVKVTSNNPDTGPASCASVTQIKILNPTSGGGANLINLSTVNGTNFPNLTAIDIRAELGNDTVYGSALNDTISGAGGQDQIYGNGGNDSLDGGRGNDTVVGGDGNDTLRGAEDNDSIDGGAGNDSLQGSFDNPGETSTTNDTLTGGLGDDSIDGGAGTDQLVETGNVNLTLKPTSLSGLGTDLLSAIERAELTGGSSANRLDAGDFSGSVTLNGAGGNDTLLGGAATDSLSGGEGNDELVSLEGNDTLDGGIGIDRFSEFAEVDQTLTDTSLVGKRALTLNSVDRVTLQGGPGDDLIDASAFTGTVEIIGYAGRDTLKAGSGGSWLFGEDDNDSLLGGSANDTLDGGNGDDTLAGGPGDDWLVGSWGTDLLVARSADWGQGNVTLTNGSLGGAASVDSLSEIEQVILIGGAENNRIDASGFAGSATLMGGSGRDSLIGGAGADMLVGQGGDDTLVGNGGNDKLDGGGGSDRLAGGAGKDTLNGGAGADQMLGQGGNDKLLARDGVLDTVNGGVGTDSAQIDSGLDVVSGVETFIP